MILDFFAGSGSNLLVSDDGFDGIVISLKKTFKELSISKDGVIISESGVMLGHLVKNAISKKTTLLINETEINCCATT